MRMIKVNNDLTFVEDPRGYYYKGKKLPGITRMLSAREGRVYPSGGEVPTALVEAANYGSAIHRAVEKFIKTGAESLPEAASVFRFLKNNFQGFELYAELLVTDREKWATAIDIVAVNDNDVIVMDIKTGLFYRQYCSWQLSIGAAMLRDFYGLQATKAYVISTKDKTAYQVVLKPYDRVKQLLGDAHA